MQRRMVVLYRRFGTTYLPHFQGPKSPRKFLSQLWEASKLFITYYRIYFW